MNLDELRSVQSKERQKDSLQNLRPSFYQEVGEYIADLEAEREHAAEAAEDPFSSPEVGRLTDEIETAKDVVEAVYERRMGKLVKQASLAAAGMPANDEGLTAEEADLFEDLVERIGSNKSRVLDVLEGVEADADADGETDVAGADPTPDEPDGRSDAPAEPPRSDDAPPTPPNDPDPIDAESPARGADPNRPSDDGGVSAADVMGSAGPTIEGDDAAPSETTADDSAPPAGDPPAAPGGSDAERDFDPVSAADHDDHVSSDGEPSAGSTDAVDDDVDRVTVKINRDLGSILGVDDREYTLSSDDVVTLPEANATPLVERDAAEPLE